MEAQAIDGGHARFVGRLACEPPSNQ